MSKSNDEARIQVIFESKFGFHAIYPPCDLAQLEAFERTLPGGKLPADYRDFLLQWNGGDFKAFAAIAFPLKDDWLEDDCGYVSGLAGLFNEENGLDLRLCSNAYGFRAAVPESYISIGDYGSWDQLCIAVDGADTGAIYYWQPGEPWPEEEPNTKSLRPVASSFAEFWESLFESMEEF